MSLHNSPPNIDISNDWVFYPLPHQKPLIEALKKNSKRQARLQEEILERSKAMNFTQALTAAREGIKVRRPTWEPEMVMWWNGFQFVHSHPYSPSQPKATNEDAYWYVIEKDDMNAEDWEKAA